MRNFRLLYCSCMWFALQATYYELLKIQPTASQQEIRKAYLKRAKEIHPDRSIDESATRLFQELNNAHETLKDPVLRKTYDRSLQPEHLDLDLGDYAHCSCFTFLWLKEWVKIFLTPCLNDLPRH